MPVDAGLEDLVHRLSEDWKPKASMRKVAPSACGPHVRTHRELELREFSCPDCATLMKLELCRKDEESLWSLSLS